MLIFVIFWMSALQMVSGSVALKKTRARSRVGKNYNIICINKFVSVWVLKYYMVFSYSCHTNFPRFFYFFKNQKFYLMFVWIYLVNNSSFYFSSNSLNTQLTMSYCKHAKVDADLAVSSNVNLTFSTYINHDLISLKLW